jgi:hypothetical protein
MIVLNYHLVAIMLHIHVTGFLVFLESLSYSHCITLPTDGANLT